MLAILRYLLFYCFGVSICLTKRVILVSKVEFSKKINNMMNVKMQVLENLDYASFLSKDEYFELVLCLAYLALSKEKIIEKDMKNNRRLDRLTKKVLTLDIDAVFASDFTEQLPNVTYAKENNNVWILDNIRDSIMHGVFEVDEEKQCFIINNTQYDRELKAEIPFSWVIAYAKYDILSKRIMDKYTVRGFYYDVSKKEKKYLYTKNEIFSSILYNVNITGSKFNVKDVEKRVKEIFEECSEVETDDSVVEKYRDKINSERIKYNEKYLASFYMASESLKEKIEHEFPGVSVNVYINNRKNKIANRLLRRTSKYYNDYDLMYDQLNALMRSKGISLLSNISNIIELLDGCPEANKELDIYERLNWIEYILKGETKKYTKLNDIYACFDDSLKKIRIICFNIHGLATLVINHENLYNSYFLSQRPEEYNLEVHSKQKYLDYSREEKKLIMRRLDRQIKLFEKQEKLKKCTHPKGITLLNNSIKLISAEIDKINEDLVSLDSTMGFTPYINRKKQNAKKIEQIHMFLDLYYYHFDQAKTVDGKKKVKKIIGKMLDEKIEEESKYTYGICYNMSEALTIIRNSLSHVGRISLGKNKGPDTRIILNDYDNDNEHTGAVICKYSDLLMVLGVPFCVEQNKSKRLIKQRNE